MLMQYVQRERKRDRERRECVHSTEIEIVCEWIDRERFCLCVERKRECVYGGKERIESERVCVCVCCEIDRGCREN